jgi:hypothetical protein
MEMQRHSVESFLLIWKYGAWGQINFIYWAVYVLCYIFNTWMPNTYEYIAPYSALKISQTYKTTSKIIVLYISVALFFNIYLEDKNSEPNCNSLPLRLICPAFSC